MASAVQSLVQKVLIAIVVSRLRQSILETSSSSVDSTIFDNRDVGSNRLCGRHTIAAAGKNEFRGPGYSNGIAQGAASNDCGKNAG
jgi:hypothetical protein